MGRDLLALSIPAGGGEEKSWLPRSGEEKVGEGEEEEGEIRLLVLDLRIGEGEGEGEPKLKWPNDGLVT